MTDVHIPKLEHDVPDAVADAALPPASRAHGRSFGTIALEVVLIALGVYLGLMGEQWREDRHHRQLAREALIRFRTEIVANRKAVLAVKDYHVRLSKSIASYLDADATARKTMDVEMRGLQPAIFDHTAWDLALATQSLADIDSNIAFHLSRIYNAQTGYRTLTSSILQALYLRPPSDDPVPSFRAIQIYYGDVVANEPELIKMYDEVLPEIDRAVGG